MSADTISITRDRVIFDGTLGKLRPHSHAVLALLIGVERPFRLGTSQGGCTCAVAVVPASVVHDLDFHQSRVIVAYVEPHQPSYASFHRAAAGACPTLARLTPAWRAAIAAWTVERRDQPLLDQARTFLGAADLVSDDRVRRLAGCFSRGELLDAKLDSLGKRVGLSPSRLVHLIKDQLGVGVRRLKQHYRFKLAALAAVGGHSLTTAAHHAGFADSGHFSRTFLETFGLSPSKVLFSVEPDTKPPPPRG